ncbi:hypothetical protein ACA910_010506 [Epithemia clementina (nom. ined.)]
MKLTAVSYRWGTALLCLSLVSFHDHSCHGWCIPSSHSAALVRRLLARNTNYWEEAPNGDVNARKSTYFPNNDAADEAYFDSAERKPDVLEWEACSSDAGTSYVLLPPLSVDCPTAVIHFVGGTFFGSAPSLWYNSFLEELVKHTQVAVVATSIPVTIFQSPLEHVSLAKKLERQFQVAWRDVLIDEYGEKMSNVSVCGLGHSLGSRLLVVLSTLGARSGGSKNRRSYPLPPDYKALVLISFTNYGAAAGIPGIYQLNRASRKLRRDALNEKEIKERKQRRTRNDYDYENDWDDDDEDWGEIFSDLGDIVKRQATKIKSALTPSEDSLEFYPSPDQLWTALTMDQRYNVSNTLVVQFDDDEVDQSAKLASALTATSSVYFSRIRGTHLTPVVPSTTQKYKRQQGDDSWLHRFNSRLGKSLARLLTGRRRSRQNEESLLLLRQVTSSYLIEILTKDRTF